MIDLQSYIIVLLLIAAVGMTYIFRVIKEQRRLFKYTIEDKDVRHFRVVLFAISITIVLCGLIPIAINLFTLFINSAGRPTHVSFLSLVYSLSVHIQSLLLSYLLWQIYRLAKNSIDK
jgi:hypothetical protein